MPGTTLNINDLFPREVLTEMTVPDGQLSDLLPEERDAIAGVVEKRRREYAAGRRLVRELLAEFGIRNFPLLNDVDRLPIWPDGIIGSISHCESCCIVAVARSGDAVRSLSVDVEPDEPLEESLWSTIATDSEMRWLESQSHTQRGRLMKLVFSAKETAYKCVYPITRVPLDFQDVSLHLEPDAGVFSARLPSSLAARTGVCPTVMGRLLRGDGMILTSAILSQSEASGLIGR